MNKLILDKTQIDELIRENRYESSSSDRLISRCIDGRYAEEENLPPLAFPGADAGELALLYATSNHYGFEIDYEKATSSLVEILGGEKNMRLHTDSHAEGEGVALGCGHIKQIRLDPQAYHLNMEQIAILNKELVKIKKQGAVEVMLEGEHMEGAVVMVKGSYSLKTRCFLETERGKREVEVFVFQQTLTDLRHKEWAKSLIKQKTVKLYKDLDEDYLYQALSDMTENHLLETSKRLAKGLPMYSVEFEEDGSFKLEEIGVV